MQINYVAQQANIGAVIASRALQGVAQEPLSRERLEDLQKLALSNSEKLANILRLDSTSDLSARPRELLTRIQNATTLLFASVDFARVHNFGAVNFLHYSQITELLVKLGEKKEFLTEGRNLFSYLELVVKNAEANISIAEVKNKSSEQARQNSRKLIELIDKFDLKKLSKSSEKADQLIFKNVALIKRRWIQVESPSSKLGRVSGNFSPLVYIKVSKFPKAE